MLSESYAALFGELTSEETEKVAAFHADFLDSSEAGQASLIKEAMEDLLQDEGYFDRFYGMLSDAGSFGDVEEKEAIAQLLPLIKEAGVALDKEAAFPDEEPYKDSKGMKGWVGPAIATAAIAPFIARMARSAGRRNKIKSSAQGIFNEHPELRSDPNSERYFGAISDFAPDVAANPLVAGNVMKAMHQIGPGSVTPKVLKELLEVQDYYDRQQSGPMDSLTNYAKLKSGGQ